MSDESKYYRFMDTIRELTQPMLVRFTQIDYDREMALVATVQNEDGTEKQIGVSRYVTNPMANRSSSRSPWRTTGRSTASPQADGALIECAHEGLPCRRRRRTGAQHQDVPPDDQPRLHHPSASG